MKLDYTHDGTFSSFVKLSSTSIVFNFFAFEAKFDHSLAQTALNRINKYLSVNCRIGARIHVQNHSETVLSIL